MIAGLLLLIVALICKCLKVFGMLVKLIELLTPSPKPVAMDSKEGPAPAAALNPPYPRALAPASVLIIGDIYSP
jgi:hypothetical protein